MYMSVETEEKYHPLFKVTLDIKTCGHLLWPPIVGEVLVLKREHENCKDKMIVAVLKSYTVVGHASTLFSQFLRRACIKGIVEMTGEKLNRGSGAWFTSHICVPVQKLTLST